MSMFRRRIMVVNASEDEGIATLKIVKGNSFPGSIVIDEESRKIFDKLLSKFRRCLCKKKADSEVTICYLDDNNSNYYQDGSSAVLTGEEGDVMVYFPEFWYKGTDDNTYYVFNFSRKKVDDTWHHAPASLVGAYKGYIENSSSSDKIKVYSRSGVTPTTNVLFAPNKNRGKGYHFIDYQKHCIICWMFYARYGTRDSCGICGTGSSSYTTVTGSTNSLGITDTTPANSSEYVNFLGIEGCWGGAAEWVGGLQKKNGQIIMSNDVTEEELVNVNSETYRAFPAVNIDSGSGGLITSIIGGEYMDVYPAGWNISSKDVSTYFCSLIYEDTGNQTFNRSGDTHYSNNYGILSLSSFHPPYVPFANKTLRLAFDGNIIVENNVETFKSLQVL